MQWGKSRWDDVPVAMLEVGRRGRITDANLRMAELLGCRRSNLVDSPLAEWVVGPPPALAAGTSLDLRLCRRDDTVVDAILTVARSKVRGRLACVINAKRDCVAGTVELHLRQAQHVARLGSWDLDISSGRLWWSEEIFRLFEVDPKQFRASYEGFLSLVHPDDRHMVRESYERSVRDRTPYDLIHRLLMPDGRIKWVHERCETFYGPAGKPVRSLGTVQDVSERHYIKGLLADRERRLAAVFNASGEAMMLFAEDAAAVLRLSDLNQVVHGQVRRLVPDYRDQELLGLTVDELCLRLPEPLRGVLARFAGQHRPPSGAGASETFEVELPVPGGSAHFEVSITTIVQTNERPSIVLFVARDITEAKTAEARLRSTLAEKETLLREVHHRVKNNLQVVSSLLALQADQVANDQARTALTESRARIQTMAMVHERLYRSQHFGSIDLAPHVRELVAMLARSSSERGLVALECDLEELVVDLDTAIPLGLVLTELVSNAFKHAFPGGRRGRLSVRTRTTPSVLELTVADDGVGLPPGVEVAQAQSLGLRIVKTLAHQLRAELEVAATGGTQVTLRIPRNGERLEPPAAASDARSRTA